MTKRTQRVARPRKERSDHDARWRRPKVEKTRWRYGTMLTPTDPAVIADDHTEGLYTINAKYVQVKTLGPRGGVHWVPLLEREEEDDAPQQ